MSVNGRRMWLSDPRAATSIEYAILASLIAMVVIVSVRAIGIETYDMLCAPLEMLERVGVPVSATCD